MHPRTMTCMEVWGGSDAVDAAVTLSGLDAWVYSRPYQQADAGGDVYYVSACATGRINRLLVADVSGHGQSVRDIAATLRDLMRRYVNYLDQSRFVLSMNKQFVTCSDAGCFATAIVTTFFAPTRTLSVCNAGHPPPLIWRAATRQWSYLDLENQGQRVANIPLGIMDLENCEQFGVDLDVGDLVLVYTDSLIEARLPNGEMLGTQGLVTLVTESTDPTKPETLIPTLLKSIDDRTQGGLDADDVTVLLLRPNGTRTRAHWINSFTAPFKVFATVLRFCAGRGPISLPDPRLPNVGGALVPALSRHWDKRKKV
jgi:sigma-B regulation protein RsbU (phosphoserine phosphatase)